MTRSPVASHAAPVVAWLAALALPVVESPTLSDPVAPTRLVILALIVGLGLLARPTGSLPRPVGVALLVGGAVYVLAALLSATPLMSLLGRFPRYEGALVVGGYAACVLIGARLFAADRAAQRHLERALAAGSGVAAALSLVQVVLAPGDRVIGTLGNSSTLGVWGLLVVGVLGWRLLEERRWWLWLGAAAGLVLVVLSASRAAQAALLVACVVAVVLGRRTEPRPAWWLPLAPGALMVLGVLVAPTARARLTGSTPFAEATVNGRLLLWQESLELVAHKPLLGVGPSRFVDSIGAFHTPQWAASVGPYAPPDSPHNLVLQVAAAGGVLGVLAVVALAAAWALSLWRAGSLTPAQSGAAVAVVGAGTAYMAGFTDLITTPMVCLLAGVAVGTQATRARGLLTARVAGAVTLAATLALGVSVLASDVALSRAIDTAEDPRPVLHSAVGLRAWDPDFRSRSLYLTARHVEGGTVDARAALADAAGLCDPLPGSIECLHTLADLQDLAGEHRAALETLATASALDPTNVDTLLKTGIAHAGLREWDAAESSFLAAQRLRPTAPEPAENLEQLRVLRGR